MVLKEWYRSDILSQVFWYGFLHVKDRSVLDIGGYIGDSALIFSFSGAKKVVSVEVSPWAINVAKENIMLNNVQNKVHLINCAIDDNDGNTLFIRDGETDIADSLNTLVVSEKHGIPVNTCTFDNLIEKYGPFDILKMDCEGCEYKAMLNSYNIDKFKEIILEYHNGNETLSEMLKSKGFKIYYLDYIIGTKLSKKPYNSKIGILYAIKD
jgi:FkbM family methyltransferase